MASLNLARLVLLLIALTIGGYLTFLLYEFLLGLLGRDANLTNRTIIWQLLEPYILDEFTFGYGFGAFWASDAVSNFLDRWGFIGNAHSGYYEAILQGGIVSILILFAIVVNAVYLLFKSYVYDKSGDLSTTLLPIILVQVVVNYVGFIILNHNSVDMFIFLLAFFIANSPKKSYARNEKIRDET
jgi:O-antigen ligase